MHKKLRFIPSIVYIDGESNSLAELFKPFLLNTLIHQRVPCWVWSGEKDAG